jgi:putative ABC transport system permease protein
MLRNYLLIAVRTLRRQPGYAAVNVFGLGVGMAACLLIGLFVWQESTYDRFHQNADRLSRVWFQEEREGQIGTFVSTPVILAPTLKETFPDVEAAVRVMVRESAVGPVERRFAERVHGVDPAFFKTFSFSLIEGDPATALAEPGRVVLTPELAERYFPDQDPLGQALPIELLGEEFVVTGIAEASPVTSSIQYDLLIPFADLRRALGEDAHTSWHNVYVETYVLTREGVAREELQAKLPSLVRQVIREEYRDGYRLSLQPITAIHLDNTLPAGIEPIADPAYLRLLTLIAFFVLLVAAINFVTLSLGQSTRRSREVGLRKTLGARREQVAAQFWGEALVLTALALGLGLGLAALFTPAFSDLAGVALAFEVDVRVLGMMLVLLAVVGLGAGAYPAVVLSGFRPIEALKDRLQISGDRSLLRRGLVVVQFALAILLIVGTLFVNRQLDFVRSAPLGFEKEQVVVVPTGMGWGPADRVLERLKDALSGHGGIEAISSAAFTLDEEWGRVGYTDAANTWRVLHLNWGEADFLETMGVELAAGRFLDPALASDSSRFLVNEAFVRSYGWATAEAAIGQTLPSPDFAGLEVAGVMRDFHFASLHAEVEPLVYTVNPNAIFRGVSSVRFATSYNRKLAVRIASANVPATLAALRQAWERAAPDAPFDYYFLDEAVQAQYVQEARLARIASAASILAILIAALGLFALATLSVTRRRKEVGVRKVLGASTAGLVALLSKDFLMLVAVAFVIAAPVAYVLVSRWLESFAYRIEPGVGVFVAAGVLAALVAFAAVGHHAFRAATADPVKTLRSE